MTDKWISQMRKGSLELSILLLLKQKAGYGYDIVSRLSQHAFVDAGESTVYPILARLKTAGFLLQKREASPHGPPRNFYYLSTAGERYLQDMIRAWGELNETIQTLLNLSRKEENL